MVPVGPLSGWIRTSGRPSAPLGSAVLQDSNARGVADEFADPGGVPVTGPLSRLALGDSVPAGLCH